MRSVRSLKRKSELRRSRSVDSVYRRRLIDQAGHLVRVTSDPHLSIPRASLTRSRTDLNNNQEGVKMVEKSYSSSLSSPSAGRPGGRGGGVIMTKQQIIDMFACPDSPGY